MKGHSWSSSSFNPPPGLHLDDEEEQDVPKLEQPYETDLGDKMQGCQSHKETASKTTELMLRVICMDHQKDHVCMPCMHMCVCFHCKEHVEHVGAAE